MARSTKGLVEHESNILYVRICRIDANMPCIVVEIVDNNILAVSKLTKYLQY